MCGWTNRRTSIFRKRLPRGYARLAINPVSTMSPPIGSQFAAGDLLILGPMEHQTGSQNHPGGGNGRSRDAPDKVLVGMSSFIWMTCTDLHASPSDPAEVSLRLHLLEPFEQMFHSGPIRTVRQEHELFA